MCCRTSKSIILGVTLAEACTVLDSLSLAITELNLRPVVEPVVTRKCAEDYKPVIRRGKNKIKKW